MMAHIIKVHEDSPELAGLLASGWLDVGRRNRIVTLVRDGLKRFNNFMWCWL